VSLFTVLAVVDHKSHVGEKLGKRVEAAIRKWVLVQLWYGANRKTKE
jgi:hypothetical protein